MNERERLAASMRRLRRSRGWSQHQVARRVGINVSQISRAEAGLRRPLTAAVQAGVFEVSEADVLDDCPHCGYDPPPGYMCMTCGSIGRELSAPFDVDLTPASPGPAWSWPGGNDA